MVSFIILQALSIDFFNFSFFELVNILVSATLGLALAQATLNTCILSWNIGVMMLRLSEIKQKNVMIHSIVK